MSGRTSLSASLRVVGIALALVAMLATTALAAPPPGRGPPEGKGPPEGVGPDRPTPVSPVAVSVADADATEGSPVVFTISLDQAANADVTVRYATSDGTATQPTHYTATTGEAVVPAGVTATTVSVPTVDDGVDNIDRSFTLDLTAVSNNGTLAQPSATGTIVDDDEPPVGGTPTLNVGDVSVTEGGTASLPITLSGPSTTDVEVTFSTTDGTASSAAGTATTAKDYEAVSNGTATILAGATSGTIDVTTYDDLGLNDAILDSEGYDEPDETFTVTVTGITGDATVVDDTGEATIEDDDAPPVLTLLARTVGEDAGAASISIDLLGRSSQPITGDWNAFSDTGDDATEDVDYTPTGATFEIPAGFTTGNITGIPLIDDSDIEGDETFTVVISNVSANASIAADGDSNTVTIQDDDGTTQCSSIDTRESTLSNDDPANAGQIPERTMTFLGERSWACQGDHDWWAVDLGFPTAGEEREVLVEGGNLGDLIVDAAFVPFDTQLPPTSLVPLQTSDGWAVFYASDGTPGRILVDLLLPGTNPDIGVEYVISYTDFSEPEEPTG